MKIPNLKIELLEKDKKGTSFVLTLHHIHHVINGKGIFRKFHKKCRLQ